MCHGHYQIRITFDLRFFDRFDSNDWAHFQNNLSHAVIIHANLENLHFAWIKRNSEFKKRRFTVGCTPTAHQVNLRGFGNSPRDHTKADQNSCIYNYVRISTFPPFSCFNHGDSHEYSEQRDSALLLQCTFSSIRTVTVSYSNSNVQKASFWMALFQIHSLWRLCKEDQGIFPK